MIYLNSFEISNRKVTNPNLYPYNVFAKKDIDSFVFNRITVLYGNNASGKSTLLNIIAKTLNIKGAEEVNNKNNKYFYQYIAECNYSLGEDEAGCEFSAIPGHSRYIKSEDVMYEVKKIQQEAILRESHLYESALNGASIEQREIEAHSWQFDHKIDNIKFGQEKYSNGEMTLQILEDSLTTDALYLLDEPETSLSPQNQVLLAEKINKHARLLGCQFIISTHSPFLLGTLDSKIYNLDSQDIRTCSWSELENVRYFYDFFKKHQCEFN
jgi:predicted ATPase